MGNRGSDPTRDPIPQFHISELQPLALLYLVADFLRVWVCVFLCVCVVACVYIVLRVWPLCMCMYKLYYPWLWYDRWV